MESGSQRAEYAYDTYGRLSSRKTSDGILTEYGYDAPGITASLVHTGTDGILESYRYGYDAAGNRIREERYRKDLEEETGIYTYGYDRLEGERHTHYTYNALNQLVHDTDGNLEHSYEYDGRGNLIRTLENGNLAYVYAFGAMNRMTRAADSMGNVAEYRYNGLGHRTGMREGVTGHTGAERMPDFGADGLMPDIPETWNKETEYILDFTKGYHNLLQREEDGNVQSYVWDSGALFMEEEGESYSYLNDLQGSVMRLSGNGRDSVASYRYDEFGTDLSGNQGQFQPFGYTGYQRDAVAGTYYAQAREYDAGSGRFTSEDVVKGNLCFPIGLNPYLYCQNQPIDYIDLNGLSREDAREYMEEYATDEKSERNENYPSYSTNCANYVSQCLSAGGVNTVYGEWFCSGKQNLNKKDQLLYKGLFTPIDRLIWKNNIYYNADDPDYDVLLSKTWNNADAQYKYFSNSENGYCEGETIKISSYEELQEALKTYNIQTGDLLYWDDEGDGNANHATIISKVDNGLYYAGNTSARFDELVTEEKFEHYEAIYIVRLKDQVFRTVQTGCLE